MKVILTTDVPKVGNRDEVKELSEGYAQNVLISKGKAILATPKALADLENRRSSLKKKREDEASAFASLIATIDNKKVLIKVKANEKGHLFKAVSPIDVVKAIKDLTGLELDEHTVVMEHIKEVGMHSVIIKRGDLKGKCEIEVEAL